MFGIFDYTKPIVDFQNFDITQLGEAFLFGGSILLIGMLTVFAVLCLLWLFLTLFKLAFHDIPVKRPKKNAAPVPAVKEKTEDVSKTDDSEIIAVIAAAIALAESENTGMKFRVVSFRKV